jgi:hypothetical protein
MGVPWAAAGDVLAHVAGVPVEEMLGASPGALVLMSGLGAWWRARRVRRRA